MTLRAEDFRLKNAGAKESQKRAGESIDQMNQGIAEKNYSLYRKGVQRLMKEVRADMPQLNSEMSYKLFLLDMVARFVDELQTVELGFTENPFDTRIGIGNLFLEPTLEVRSKETGDVLAVFESLDGFTLIPFKRTKLEALQDKRIANQDKRKVLLSEVSQLKQLLADPKQIPVSSYFAFLQDTVKVSGLVKGVYRSIANRKAEKLFSRTVNAFGIEEELEELEKELGDIQTQLDGYATAVLEAEWLEQEFNNYRSIFERLMSQYQVKELKSK